jgi:hypothetical protein
MYARLAPRTFQPGTNVIILKIFMPNNWRKLRLSWLKTLLVCMNRNIDYFSLAKKLYVKITGNSDHNIDPRIRWWRLVLLPLCSSWTSRMWEPLGIRYHYKQILHTEDWGRKWPPRLPDLTPGVDFINPIRLLKLKLGLSLQVWFYRLLIHLNQLLLYIMIRKK